MNDDEDDSFNFEVWYNLRRKYFPQKLHELIDTNYELLNFLFSVYQKITEKLSPAIKDLMRKHYPVFKTEKRPMVVSFLDDIASTTGYKLLLQLFQLIKDQKAGVNMRVKYPKFDQWVDFYGRPQKPKTVDEDLRSLYTWMSDDEWETYRNNENKAMLDYFNWQEKRKFEFIDLVQSLLFSYYPDLQELDPDEWIIYAVCIRDEYEQFLCCCEDAELFIDCGFPEEEIKLSDKEFMQNYENLSDEIKEHASELRRRRIAGELV